MNQILFDEKSKNVVRIINKEEELEKYNKILQDAKEGVLKLIEPSTKNEVWEVLYNQDETKNILSLEEMEVGDFVKIMDAMEQQMLGPNVGEAWNFFEKLENTFGYNSTNLYKIFRESESPEMCKKTFVELRRNFNKLLTDVQEIKGELYLINREYKEKYNRNCISINNKGFNGFFGLINSMEPKVASIKYTMLDGLTLKFLNTTISGDKEEVIQAIRSFIEKGTIEDNFKSGR